MIQKLPGIYEGPALNTPATNIIRLPTMDGTILNVYLDMPSASVGDAIFTVTKDGVEIVNPLTVADGDENVSDDVSIVMTQGGILALNLLTLPTTLPAGPWTFIVTYDDGDNTLSPAGKQTKWIPASQMLPATTSGAASAQLESTTNKLNYNVLDFDGATQEFAHFQVAFPKAWDKGTVSFKAFWETANTGTAGAAIGLQGVATSDGDTLDSAFGAAVYVTDAAQSSAAKQYVTPESGAVTIAGTPANGDLCYFRVARDPANVADTMTEDMRLIGIQLFYSTTTGNDA
jgi:hypothetical protein